MLVPLWDRSVRAHGDTEKHLGGVYLHTVNKDLGPAVNEPHFIFVSKCAIYSLCDPMGLCFEEAFYF